MTFVLFAEGDIPWWAAIMIAIGSALIPVLVNNWKTVFATRSQVHQEESKLSHQQRRAINADAVKQWEALTHKLFMELDEIKREYKIEMDAGRLREEKCNERLTEAFVQIADLKVRVEFLTKAATSVK